MFLRLIRREFSVAWHSASDAVYPLWFFLTVITLFPLGIGADPGLLSRIAPGVLLIAALLASVLILDRLFRDDYLDGSLEQLLLLPFPLPLAVLAKVTAHWLITGVPLLLLSPLAALFLSLDFNSWYTVLAVLLLVTPTLSLLGAIGVALTVGLRRGGVLLSLLVLPLTIPVLIFGSAAIDAAGMGLPVLGYLAVLAAILLVSTALAPFAISAALRISIN
ncbi:MAG: Heme exporter protein B [Candidatus Erwinia impunctatus]|nr:Heme exporter protein B [Culicoides impunctatus]